MGYTVCGGFFSFPVWVLPATLSGSREGRGNCSLKCCCAGPVHSFPVWILPATLSGSREGRGNCSLKCWSVAQDPYIPSQFEYYLPLCPAVERGKRKLHCEMLTCCAGPVHSSLPVCLECGKLLGGDGIQVQHTVRTVLNIQAAFQPQSTYFTRDETGLVCLPTQLERTLQLYWWW
jgi:hypothetical protein